MMTDAAPSVPWMTRMAYALPAFTLAIIGIPVYIYLPKFYTDTVGIDIATVGMLLLAVRIFDAVTDPVIGHLSDTLITPWGRRRPWIALGAMGLCLSLMFLFIPPAVPGNEQVFRFGFWLFALFLFWTILTVPYESLGPELSNDYHERTTIFGLRDGLLILGTCVAAVSPAISAGCLTALGFHATERMTFMAIALMYGPLVLVASFVCVWFVREKSILNPRKSEGLFSSYSAVIQNRPFVILLGAYTLSSFGSNLPATLILYYVQYVLQADHAEVFLAVYFLVGISCLPLWVALSRKTGKKAAWILSMIINTGAFSGVFFLGPGDVMAYGILVAVSGVGFGAGLALPSSIQADVIDYDELITGQRREGRYIGLWSISKKLAAALGVGLGLWFLGQAGYVPNTPQNQNVVDMLRILYALIPCACNALSIGIIFFYPMTEQMHHDIQKRISEAKHPGLGAND